MQRQPKTYAETLGARVLTALSGLDNIALLDYEYGRIHLFRVENGKRTIIEKDVINCNRFEKKGVSDRIRDAYHTVKRLDLEHSPVWISEVLMDRIMMYK